jgi:ABC-type multidrug transport system fused ATPase/permease subunit
VLLRRTRVVLLDEATSSVDFATDALMHRAIGESITVTGRLWVKWLKRLQGLASLCKPSAIRYATLIRVFTATRAKL